MRNLLLMILAVAISTLGCKNHGGISYPPISLTHADSLLLEVMPKDTLLARVQAKKAAVHPDSLKAGHWVVRLDDPEQVKAVTVHFSFSGIGGYHGSWERQQVCFKRDMLNPDATFRKETMAIFSTRVPDHGLQLRQDVLDLIYREMDLKDNAAMAMRAAAAMDPDHAADSIIAFLQQEDVDRNDYYEGLTALGNTRPNARTVSFLKAAVTATDHGEDNRSEYHRRAAISSMIDLHSKAPLDLQREIERNLMAQNAQETIESPYRWEFFRALAHGDPLPEYLPFIEARATDPELHELATLAIAKIKGPGARALIEADMRDSTELFLIPEAISHAWADDPMAALPLLQKCHSMALKQGWEQDLLDAVWRFGGQALANAFVAGITDAELRKQVQTYFKDYWAPMQPGHPLLQQAKVLQEAGLLDGPLSEATFDSVRNFLRPYPSLGLDEALLDHLQILASFDPPGEGTNGAIGGNSLFLFQLCSAHRLDSLDFHSKKVLDNSGTEYEQLWLRFGDRAYFTELPPVTDPTYRERQRWVLDALLADAGIAERYCPFPSVPGEPQRYLFTTPEKAAKAIPILQRKIKWKERIEPPSF